MKIEEAIEVLETRIIKNKYTKMRLTLEAIETLVNTFEEMKEVIIDSVENTDSDFDYEFVVEHCYKIIVERL